MQDTQEIWKDVPNYEGLYQVSNLGRVKSVKRVCKKRWGPLVVKELILKPGSSNEGYLHVILNNNKIKKGFSIQSLVAQAFLGHIPCGIKMVVNHKDFNVKNNNVENLEVITHRQNCGYRRKKGISPHSSPHPGVAKRPNKSGPKWVVRFGLKENGVFKNKYLGTFNDEESAINAYKNHLENYDKETQRPASADR